MDRWMNGSFEGGKTSSSQHRRPILRPSQIFGQRLSGGFVPGCIPMRIRSEIELEGQTHSRPDHFWIVADRKKS